MIADIILVEGDKITVKKGDEEKVYEMEEHVVQFAKKGPAEINFNDNTKKISFITMEPTSDPDENQRSATEKPKKWEDDIVDFETLLNKAHELFGKFSIRTEALNIDLEKKFAFFKATVTIGAGESAPVFIGHGDTTDENVSGSFIKPHFIRMAETRAIVRALRWATNNAQCAEEEKK